jgi:hypothetical protein
MPFDAERLIHDNPPTPEQLHALAAVGVKSAVSRERFKTLKKNQGVHYFIDELDHMIATEAEEELPMQIRHRMAVRIAARPPQERSDKIWSLKYFDTYFVESRDEPGNWVGERSTYRFEWTRARILMADRTLRLVGFPAPYEENLENDLEHFKVSDDDAAILQVSEEMRMVSSDDCDVLIKDMSDYFSVVEAASRY